MKQLTVLLYSKWILSIMLLMVGTIILIGCKDDNEITPEVEELADGIIYATPASKSIDTKWDEALILGDNVILYTENEDGTSSVLAEDTSMPGKNTIIGEFDNLGRLKLFLKNNLAIELEYINSGQTVLVSLSTAEEDCEFEINIEELSATLSRTELNTTFEKFEVPIVHRVIEMKNVIDVLTIKDKRELIIKSVLSPIKTFIGNKVTEEGKFLVDVSFISIESAIIDGPLMLPLEIGLAMFEDCERMIAEIKDRKYKEQCGYLDVMILNERKIDDNKYELSFSVNGVSTIPQEYIGKNVIGIIYKEVEPDSEETKVDLYDKQSKVIYQISPVKDGIYTIKTDVAVGKKVLWRVYVMPYTAVIALNEGKTTSSRTTLMKYTITKSFVNIPVKFSYQQIKFIGRIEANKVENEAMTYGVYKKEAIITLDITMNREDVISSPLDTPIINWGIVVYRDGEIVKEYDYVDFDGQDVLRCVINSDVEHLTLDYESFTATTHEHWSIGAFVVYAEGYYSKLNKVYSPIEPLVCLYHKEPSYTHTSYEITDMTLPRKNLAKVYAKHNCKISGCLFIDDIKDIVSVHGSFSRTTQPAIWWDGEIESTITENWAFNVETDGERFLEIYEMKSGDKKYYSTNCIYQYSVKKDPSSLKRYICDLPDTFKEALSNNNISD